MASEITIPRLGWNMEEGTFVGWLKADGQPIAAGEPLFSLEGDKATEDVESLETGVLRIPPDGPQDGAKVAVGTLIGYLVAPGEPAPFEAGATSSFAVGSGAKSRDGQAPSESLAGVAFREGEAPSEPGIAVVHRTPETPSEPGVGAARSEPRPPGMRLRISPRARRVARELGMDAVAVHGSGASGRILERDIRAAAEAGVIAAPPSSPDRETVPSSEYWEFAVTPIRRTIAERMTQSVRTAAGVTLSTTVDATHLVDLRRQFKTVTDGGDDLPSVSFTDIIVKLTAQALEKHPLLNARWNGETIALSKTVNIGIAVDTDAGLLVPVVRDVPQLTLRQLAAQSRELIELARSGRLRPAEMRDGTFTVTNLGPMGIEMFTPIINPPESAILGLGRIQKQVVVDDKQFVARDRMVLSLTFDHRIVDGGPAARFLQALSLRIENPSPYLLP